jgi:hypothetical protein
MTHTHKHAHTTYIRQDFSGRGIGPSQRSLPVKTQYSQETGIHAPGGIQTRNPSKRAAADQPLRPRGHWDPSFDNITSIVGICSTTVIVVLLIGLIFCQLLT